MRGSQRLSQTNTFNLSWLKSQSSTDWTEHFLQASHCRECSPLFKSHTVPLISFPLGTGKQGKRGEMTHPTSRNWQVSEPRPERRVKTPTSPNRRSLDAVYVPRQRPSVERTGEADTSLSALHYTVVWQFNYKEQRIICAFLVLCSDKPQSCRAGIPSEDASSVSSGGRECWGAMWEELLFRHMTLSTCSLSR